MKAQNTNNSYLHQKEKDRANAILMDREARFNYTLSLIDRYKKPVLVGRVNYPGLCKNNGKVSTSFAALQDLLTSHFQGGYDLVKHWHGADGPALILVLRSSARKWKRTCMEIEESHVQGRVWDLDVYGTTYEPLSRTDLGKAPRTCLVCGENAKLCSAQNKHPLKDVIKKIDSIIEGRGGESCPRKQKS